MIWCWVSQEGLSTQVCCDLLSSKDGTLMGPRRSKDDPQVVDLYVTCNDLFYADQWPEPRLGSKAWVVCFEAIFEEVYGYKPKYLKYGKPESIAYDFAEQMILEKCKQEDIEISNYYMIGDNPLSDIEGANRRGEEN